MPPYLPVSLVGLMTSGSSGRRCSTAGRLPALTWSASIGASLNFLGILAGSVTTSGTAFDGAAATGAGVVAAGAAFAGALVAGGGAVGATAGLAGADVGAAGAEGPQAAMTPAAAPSIAPRISRRVFLDAVTVV